MKDFTGRPKHLRPVELSDVAALSDAECVQGTTRGHLLSGISLASNRLWPGDLFVGLPGQHVHGASFAKDAVRRGAAAVVTDAQGATMCADLAVPVLVVADPRAILGRLSAEIFDHPSRSLHMLGVTGTQGKTTTTRLLEGALRASGVRSAVIGTVGTMINGQQVDSDLTTPEAPELQGLLALMVEQGVRSCAMELSSHALVLGRVDAITFDVAAFLNLGRDHLDFHHTMDEYFAAKASLFTPTRARRGLTTVDDPYGERLLELASIPMQTMSISGRDADWQAVEIVSDMSGSDFQVLGPAGLRLRTRVPLVGEFNVANALCAIAMAASAGLDPEAVASGLPKGQGVPGRLESIDVGQEFMALVDYAHKPDALEVALTELRSRVPGQIILVLGAGGDRDTGKRAVMGEVAARLSDHFVITDDNPRTEAPASIRDQLKQGADRVEPSVRAVVMEIPDRAEAIREAVARARAGDVVIVAGKGHETGQDFGDHVLPFDDREQLRRALEQRA